MNNLSYVIVIFLFAGVVWVGVDRRENLKRIEAERVQSQLDEQQARIDAENARIAEMDKFIREISHDNDPVTKLFNVKLQAVSADVENDEMSYKWEQVPVSDDYVGGDMVELSSDDKPTTYFQAPAGEYRFTLTVTDVYGDSNVDSQVIKINPEPNTAPSVDIKVEEGVEPLDPFEGDLDKIKEFQTKSGLTPDGKWGPASQKAWDDSQKQESEEKE